MKAFLLHNIELGQYDIVIYPNPNLGSASATEVNARNQKSVFSDLSLILRGSTLPSNNDKKMPTSPEPTRPRQSIVQPTNYYKLTNP